MVHTSRTSDGLGISSNLQSFDLRFAFLTMMGFLGGRFRLLSKIALWFSKYDLLILLFHARVKALRVTNLVIVYASICNASYKCDVLCWRLAEVNERIEPIVFEQGREKKKVLCLVWIVSSVAVLCNHVTRYKKKRSLLEMLLSISVCCNIQ